MEALIGKMIKDLEEIKERGTYNDSPILRKTLTELNIKVDIINEEHNLILYERMSGMMLNSYS